MVTLSLLQFIHDEIIFENYDDEMVLLNLPAGIYYTLDRVGGDSLLILLSASTLEAALVALKQRYSTPVAEISEGLGGLITSLLQAGIVVPRKDEETGIDVAPVPPLSAVPFTIPHFEQFNDIEDILKFDPVHEVTESGWPSIRNNIDSNT